MVLNCRISKTSNTIHVMFFKQFYNILNLMGKFPGTSYSIMNIAISQMLYRFFFSRFKKLIDSSSFLHAFVNYIFKLNL